MDDPLDLIDFVDVLRYGDPSRWKYLGPTRDGPMPAASPLAQLGTMEHYDLYEDEFGRQFELHYLRHPDGTVADPL